MAYRYECIAAVHRKGIQAEKVILAGNLQVILPDDTGGEYSPYVIHAEGAWYLLRDGPNIVAESNDDCVSTVRARSWLKPGRAKDPCEFWLDWSDDGARRPPPPLRTERLKAHPEAERPGPAWMWNRPLPGTAIDGAVPPGLEAWRFCQNHRYVGYSPTRVCAGCEAVEKEYPGGRALRLPRREGPKAQGSRVQPWSWLNKAEFSRLCQHASDADWPAWWDCPRTLALEWAIEKHLRTAYEIGSRKGWKHPARIRLELSRRGVIQWRWIRFSLPPWSDRLRLDFSSAMLKATTFSTWAAGPHDQIQAAFLRLVELFTPGGVRDGWQPYDAENEAGIRASLGNAVIDSIRADLRFVKERIKCDPCEGPQCPRCLGSGKRNVWLRAESPELPYHEGDDEEFSEGDSEAAYYGPAGEPDPLEQVLAEERREFIEERIKELGQPRRTPAPWALLEHLAAKSRGVLPVPAWRAAVRYRIQSAWEKTVRALYFRGQTQEEYARRAKVDQGTVSRWHTAALVSLESAVGPIAGKPEATGRRIPGADGIPGCQCFGGLRRMMRYRWGGWSDVIVTVRHTGKIGPQREFVQIGGEVRPVDCESEVLNPPLVIPGEAPRRKAPAWIPGLVVDKFPPVGVRSAWRDALYDDCQRRARILAQLGLPVSPAQMLSSREYVSDGRWSLAEQPLEERGSADPSDIVGLDHGETRKKQKPFRGSKSRNIEVLTSQEKVMLKLERLVIDAGLVALGRESRGRYLADVLGREIRYVSDLAETDIPVLGGIQIPAGAEIIKQADEVLRRYELACRAGIKMCRTQLEIDAEAVLRRTYIPQCDALAFYAKVAERKHANGEKRLFYDRKQRPRWGRDRPVRAIPQPRFYVLADRMPVW